MGPAAPADAADHGAVHRPRPGWAVPVGRARSDAGVLTPACEVAQRNADASTRLAGPGAHGAQRLIVQLTSGTFALLIILAAVGSIVVTAWLWPRLARQRVVPILARISL